MKNISSEGEEISLTSPSAPSSSTSVSKFNNDFDGYRWIIFNGKKHLATLNLIKGNTLYDQKLIKIDKD
jgi:hypothetical protein